MKFSIHNVGLALFSISVFGPGLADGQTNSPPPPPRAEAIPPGPSLEAVQAGEGVGTTPEKAADVVVPELIKLTSDVNWEKRLWAADKR